MVRSLAYPVRTTLRSGLDTFYHAAAVYVDLADAKFGILYANALVLGFPVGNGRTEQFFRDVQRPLSCYNATGP